MRLRKDLGFFKPYEAILPRLIRNRGILSYYMPRLAIDPKQKGPYCLGYKRTEAYSISELKQKKNYSQVTASDKKNLKQKSY